jgi:hypothetical protein
MGALSEADMVLVKMLETEDPECIASHELDECAALVRRLAGRVEELEKAAMGVLEVETGPLEGVALARAQATAITELDIVVHCARAPTAPREAATCGFCPHPEHFGLCSWRNGQSANPCNCLHDATLTDLPTGTTTTTPVVTSSSLAGGAESTGAKWPGRVYECPKCLQAMDPTRGCELGCNAEGTTPTSEERGE